MMAKNHLRMINEIIGLDVEEMIEIDGWKKENLLKRTVWQICVDIRLEGDHVVIYKEAISWQCV